jgi:hypothetical protein
MIGLECCDIIMENVDWRKPLARGIRGTLAAGV